jgi:hypothetical protein
MKSLAQLTHGSSESLQLSNFNSVIYSNANLSHVSNVQKTEKVHRKSNLKAGSNKMVTAHSITHVPSPKASDLIEREGVKFTEKPSLI